MSKDLEKLYLELLSKSEYDLDAKNRVAMLEQTLDEFGIINIRAAIAGSLVWMDNVFGEQLHAYLDMEIPQNDQMIRMLTRFKQMQGKRAPALPKTCVDTPV